MCIRDSAGTARYPLGGRPPRVPLRDPLAVFGHSSVSRCPNRDKTIQVYSVHLKKYTYLAVLVEPAFPPVLEPVLYVEEDFDMFSRHTVHLLHVIGGGVPVDESFPMHDLQLSIPFGDPNAVAFLPLQLRFIRGGRHR